MSSTRLQALTCALFLFSFGQLHIGLTAAEVSLAQQSAATEHFKFTRVNSGRDVKPGGVEISFSGYKSADSIEVQRLVERYESKQQALAGFKRLTKHALKVVQKGTKVDANGHEIGERVELIIRRSKDGPGETVIAWVDGQRVFKLVSQSREHVLDFEKQDYPASLPH